MVLLSELTPECVQLVIMIRITTAKSDCVNDKLIPYLVTIEEGKWGKR